VDVIEAVVVVPARDEEARIADCLRALARQTLGPETFSVVLVLDACADRTGERAAAVAADTGLALTAVAGPGRGTGPARALGMDLACAQLLQAGRPQGLIATTDADSRPAEDWLARQLAHRDAGATVIAGRIELDAVEADDLPERVRHARERDAAARLRLVRRADPDAGHHHFAGASLAITAAAYRAVGGLEPRRALEDEGFAQRLAEHGIAIRRAPDVVVTTSARVRGRAARGLSVDLAIADWMEHRRFTAGDYRLDALARRHRGEMPASVIIPTRECAATIGGVLDHAVGPARRAGLVEEVVVVDAASTDGTARIAEAHGARVLQQDALDGDLGPALGKGDAMWRALGATSGDLVCFMDGDTADPDPAHLVGLLGPLLDHPPIAFVKGSFERPLKLGDRTLAHEGGRVTELMARPLINLHAPLLAGFGQPLAGEFAARRELLRELPFPVGYGVEIATLVDALDRCGLDALAECHLGTRQNRHQSLRALGEMAYAVLATLERRLPGGPRSAISERFVKPWDDAPPTVIPLLERPPRRLRDVPSLPADGVIADSA
jgi:glucosyl-3-phosphoglycerate synthase